jgi:hypothetical protein
MGKRFKYTEAGKKKAAEYAKKMKAKKSPPKARKSKPRKGY